MINTGLVIIDMQPGRLYFYRNPVISQQELFIKKVREAKDHAKVFHIPVFFVEEEGFGLTIPQLGNVPADCVMPKQNGAMDSFSNSYLVQALRDRNINRVAIAGVYTSECILESCLGAIRQGLEVAVSKDIVGDSDFRRVTKRFEDLPSPIGKFFDYRNMFYQLMKS